MAVRIWQLQRASWRATACPYTQLAAAEAWPSGRASDAIFSALRRSVLSGRLAGVAGAVSDAPGWSTSRLAHWRRRARAESGHGRSKRSDRRLARRAIARHRTRSKYRSAAGTSSCSRPSAERASPARLIPNNTWPLRQWFRRRDRRHIYALAWPSEGAIRAGDRGEDRERYDAAQDLANGSRGEPGDAGQRDAAVGLYAETGTRHEPAHLKGLAPLYAHMCSRGRRALAAR